MGLCYKCPHVRAFVLCIRLLEWETVPTVVLLGCGQVAEVNLGRTTAADALFLCFSFHVDFACTRAVDVEVVAEYGQVAHGCSATVYFEFLAVDVGVDVRSTGVLYLYIFLGMDGSFEFACSADVDFYILAVEIFDVYGCGT